MDRPSFEPFLAVIRRDFLSFDVAGAFINFYIDGRCKPKPGDLIRIILIEKRTEVDYRGPNYTTSYTYMVTHKDYTLHITSKDAIHNYVDCLPNTEATKILFGGSK